MPEATSAPATAPQSPIAGIKSFFASQQAQQAPETEAAEEQESGGVAAPAEAAETDEAPAPKKQEAPAEEAEAEETDSESVQTDDAAEVEVQLSTLKDLAEATELDLEKVLDLTLPTKIDGKEGTARIRDLLRGYQLDGHINQKLATLDNDRKDFESKRIESEKAATERLQALDQGLTILDRALQGELASVNWQQLQTTDPQEFNSKYVAYQQRFGQLQQIASQIQAEKQRQQSESEGHAKSWLEEQQKLLKAKVPEWADDTKRAQDKASIVEYLKAYGITAEEFNQLADHRVAMVVRDAWKYGALQKEKPTLLKKVKTAPKLLKPGTKQSREARESMAAKDDVARLRRSGKTSDAAAVLKRQLFGTRK